jgi:hypothetical protein
MSFAVCRRSSLILLAAALALIVGCKEDVITEYDAPRETQERLLAIMMPHGESTWWYFVTSGPAPTVAAHLAELNEFLESLSFAGDEPTWKLPENWKRGRDKPSRLATLVFGDTEHPLELRVSSLDSPNAGDIKMNVNRWRGQIGLGGLSSESDAKALVVDKPINGNKAIRLDVVGPGGAKSMMPAEPLSYQLPESWKKVANPAETMRLVTYETKVGDKKAEVTIQKFRGGGGDDLSNVERWRGLVKLPKDASKDELKKHIRPGFRLAGEDALYADITGDDERILGVLLRRDGLNWAIKLQGPKEVVKAQQPTFDKFLETVRFAEAEGDN